jgi:hypothetical protein
MLFNRITDSLSALVLFVLQELTLTQKGYKPPITVKTINNGELTASSNVSSFTNVTPIRLTIKEGTLHKLICTTYKPCLLTLAPIQLRCFSLPFFLV